MIGTHALCCLGKITSHHGEKENHRHLNENPLLSQIKRLSSHRRMGPAPEKDQPKNWLSSMRASRRLPAIRHADRIQAWVPSFDGMTTFTWFEGDMLASTTIKSYAVTNGSNYRQSWATTIRKPIRRTAVSFRGDSDRYRMLS
jgi:hypothetical protein